MKLTALSLLGLLATMPAWAAPRIRILAAENVYGAVAQAVAGPAADVTSVLSNPAQDPHDFEANAATARAVAAADIVIVNGLDYDPWLDRLLAASPRPGRVVIRVADLVGAHEGDNPHLWYAPGTMVSVAEALSASLSAWDPPDTASFTARSKRFTSKMAEVRAAIADMRSKFAGTKVTATEPVFGQMADAIGLNSLDPRFALAVMNGTEPRAGDVASIEDDVQYHRVRVLFYNDQVQDAASQRLLAIARAAGVTCVGVDETMPAGTDYPAWLLHTLAALRAALSGAG